MADSPKSAVPVSDAVQLCQAEPGDAVDQAGLPLFRFGLRQLFFFVAAICALLAGLGSVGGVPALALLLAAVVIVFHVFSTALGSHLRRHANRVQAQEPGGSPRPDIGETPGAPRPLPWYGRRGASFGLLPRVVAAAFFLGGSAGMVALTVTTGQRTSLPGLVVAAVSLAALSGWFAFVGGSFVAIVRGGFHEVEEHQATAAPPSRK